MSDYVKAMSRRCQDHYDHVKKIASPPRQTPQARAHAGKMAHPPKATSIPDISTDNDASIPLPTISNTQRALLGSKGWKGSEWARTDCRASIALPAISSTQTPHGDQKGGKVRERVRTVPLRSHLCPPGGGLQPTGGRAAPC